MAPARARLETALLEIGLVLAWSSTFIGAVLAAQTSSVFGVLLWRFVLVALVLSPFLWQAIRRRPGWRWLGVQASLGAIGMFACLASGVKAIDLGVPAGTAALVSALQPLVTAALAGPVLNERVLPRQWLGLGLGLAGVAVAVGPLGSGDLLSYALVVVSMLCIVAITLIAKAGWDNSHFLAAFSVQALVAAVLFVPMAWLDGALLPEWTMAFAAALAWAVVLSTACAYGLYYACLQRTSAVRVGSLIYLTPPVTTLLAWLMFGQPITLPAAAGFAVCMLGVWLARPRSGPAVASPSRPTAP